MKIFFGAILMLVLAASGGRADGTSEFERILDEHGGGIASTNGVYVAGLAYCKLDYKAGVEAYKLRLEMTSKDASATWRRMIRAAKSSLKEMRDTKMTCDDDIKNRLTRKTF